MMSGIKTFNLLQHWWILSSGRCLLLRPTVKICQILTVHVQAGSFHRFQRNSHSTSGNIVDNGSDSMQYVVSMVLVKEKSLKIVETVGAFQKLPMVMPSADILSSALRKARNVTATKGIANIAKRERNKGAKQLDALMKELAVPLRVYIEKFPKKWNLHPYERSLIQLTFGDGSYEEVLKRVDDMRKILLSVGKQHASLCAQSLSKREAGERFTEGLKKLEEVFKLHQNSVDDLLNVAKTLRAMPVVDLQIPTLCLVGAPNVGKSSLVRILSTGKPEVCNYPFTTRGILMGHIVINFERFQVTDTPGLLRRHDDDRNNLEKLTLAALEHLPTAILYVHDLTGECGTSPDDQFTIYKNIKERFGNHLWVDVVSKSDLLQEPVDTNLEDENDDVRRYKAFGPEEALWVSVKTEAGISELKSRVKDLLISQMDRIRGGSCNHGECQG
ncbi:putative tRNA modification GTPase mnmE [Platanthera zijinensis]|uniref:tRNA modification GTPase mnmE n=1 Tax=Platanthera zijinensis TaxID=2320716 RepID=A0AAP0G5Z8_9ASPA